MLLIPRGGNLKENTLLTTELGNIPGIKGWSFSTSPPSGGEAIHWGTLMSIIGEKDPNQKHVTTIMTDDKFCSLYGLQLKAGDEVVATKQDYPNMVNAYKQRELRDGIKMNWINLELPTEDENYLVNHYVNAFTPKTKLVHITHIINWNGQIIPVKKIAAEAHKRGIEVVVDGDSIDIEMRIYEGKPAIIDKITISGNTKTHDHVILRELRTVPGDKFSRSDLIRSQRELAALQYFNQEKINPNVVPNAENGTVDIGWELEEKSSDQLELSAGWGGGIGGRGRL